MGILRVCGALVMGGSSCLLSPNLGNIYSKVMVEGCITHETSLNGLNKRPKHPCNRPGNPCGNKGNMDNGRNREK